MYSCQEHMGQDDVGRVGSSMLMLHDAEFSVGHGDVTKCNIGFEGW
jgi:hypothetical protein